MSQIDEMLAAHRERMEAISERDVESTTSLARLQSILVYKGANGRKMPTDEVERSLERVLGDG